jgi:hypothetical protein
MTRTLTHFWVILRDRSNNLNKLQPTSRLKLNLFISRTLQQFHALNLNEVSVMRCSCLLLLVVREKNRYQDS